MKKIRKIFISAVLVINTIYIVVRFLSIPIFQGLPSFILGLNLFIAEFLGFLAYIIYIYVFTGKNNIKEKNISSLNGHIPTIDVFICTYNEDFTVLAKTIMAAKKLNYPQNKFTVHVLDDGNRSELKELCHNFFKVNYISREKNLYAKAGNINNALKQTSGELFTILDADMICKPYYLQETVGYFSDKELAFVQTPQTYYNLDVYQYNVNKKYPNEQDFFMRYIEPARSSRNCVLHIGTNAIFRRKYVENVGLYPTNSITEDMALGLLLQAKGYKSVYINKTLVCGLGACTYKDLINQRDRWCRGNLQVLKNYKKVLFKQLNYKQRMVYLDGILYWFSGLTKLIFIITPIIYLLTGLVIVNLPPKFLFPLFLLAFTMQILLSKCILPKEISKNYFKFFIRGEFYNTIIAPHLSFSIFKHYFCRQISGLKFNVTQKKLSIPNGHFYFKNASTHLVLLILTIVSIVVGTINLGKNLYLENYLINLFWVIYNIPGLLVSLKIAYQPARDIFKESILPNNASLSSITNFEIKKCIQNLSYSDLDMIMDNIINNIEPYKTNLITDKQKMK